MDNRAANMYKNPAELLQKLISFNTTNPPGDEAACIKYIDKLLKDEGFETKICGEKPERLNLITKLNGSGEAPPILLYGHIDVVTTEHQDWKHDPFSGIIAEGCIWGRGALDMKGPLVMMLSALMRAKQEGFIPKGDIILAVVCDEEDEGELGAKYMTEEHAELFAGVSYAIGEIGGFTMHMDNKRFYPIMISEKQKCSLRAVIKGPAGHGSMPMKGGAMAKLAQLLAALDSHRLPVHITPPVRQMLEALSSNMSFPSNMVLRGLLKKSMTDKLIGVLGDKAKAFDPILHNTLNATIVRGGNKINVIPGEIIVEFDGRLLPGCSPADMIIELKELLGSDVDFEITTYVPGPQNTDMGLFDTLSDILKSIDNKAIPIPFVVSGCTDARYFASLGIQTYGFTPMLLPKELDFAKLIHGANERIPIEALEFGCRAILELIKQYGK